MFASDLSHRPGTTSSSRCRLPSQASLPAMHRGAAAERVGGSQLLLGPGLHVRYYQPSPAKQGGLCSLARGQRAEMERTPRPTSQCTRLCSDLVLKSPEVSGWRLRRTPSCQWFWGLHLTPLKSPLLPTVLLPGQPLCFSEYMVVISLFKTKELSLKL